MKKAKFRKLITLTLTLLMMVTCIPFSAFAVSNDIHDILFDPEYYAAANPDVVNALGRSEAALRGHYNRHGKAEGRAPSALFDPKFYANLYPDLKAAFQSDWTALYNHFCTYGVREGRQGSAAFSVEAYKARYSDLRSAFGTGSSSNYLYLKHWREYGAREGRVATAGSPVPPTNRTPAQSTKTMYVRTSNVNNTLRMRSGPSTSYSVVTSLSFGTAVTVHSTSNGWAKVTANGKTGYVSTQYLTETNPKGSVTPSSNTQTVNGLTSPVPNGAKFNKKTNDNGWYGYHDINRGITTQTPVYAITNGTAYFYQKNTNGVLRSYGNYIRFVSADGKYEVRYAHLRDFNGMPTPIKASAPFPCSGAKSDGYVGKLNVSAGQTLGWIGTTGNSSGLHLHIEVYQNGKRVDPTVLFPNLI